jgi:hypothetical protein
MRIVIKKTLSIAIILSLISFSSLINFIVRPAYAGLLSSASIQMSDSRPTEPVVTYTALFTPSGVTPIKCIKLAFNAQADMLGSSPSGLLTDTAVKGTFNNLTAGSWTINTATSGEIRYTNGAGEATIASPTTVGTTTIHNPSSATFYAQISTYTETDCSTGPVDSSNVIAMATVGGVTATVTVSPTISFSVANYVSAVNGSGDSGPVTTSSSSIPFGTVAAGATAWGAQTLTVSTNASNGYTLYVRYSGAMTNANSDTIRNQSGTPAAAEDFDGSGSLSSLAYTADHTGVSFGSNKWAGLTTTNTAIATRGTEYNADATHIEYKVGISNTQPPGAYSTVIAYTATPSY